MNPEPPKPRSAGKRRQSMVARLNRLYTMLSQINRVIIRVQDPHALYEAACRIALEEGDFTLAWIGLLEPATRQIVPIDHVGGNAPRLVDFQLRLAGEDDDPSISETCLVIDEGRPCIINQASIDPRCAAWIDSGLGAIASFPLMLEGKVMGALTVVASDADFFDASEISLLTEMSDDISFALEMMRREERRIATESRIRFLAYYDSHTGLPSQNLFEARLREACEKPDGKAAVLVVMLKRYHEILETLGHTAGLEMAQSVARTLEILLPSACVARLTESEFGILLEVTDRNELEKDAGHIRYALSAGLYVGGREVFLDIFIGIALYPEHGTANEVMKRAATAAGSARQNGQMAGYCFFTPAMEQYSNKLLDLDAALRRAVERNEFLLHYQPQVNLSSGRLTGAEALLRWERPDHGLISPLEFIPHLEQSGLINEVGAWALQEACRCNKAWQDAGFQPIQIAVNLSARQFVDGDMHATVVKALENSGLESQWLELELTESVVLQNAEATIRALKNLQALGVKQALDDFGTGYSSLSYLQRLPVDRIKIDRAFVRDLTSNPNDAAICRAVVGMAHSLGMSVLAEGVETEGQASYLRTLGCQDMQGYFFSRPLTEADFTELLRSRRVLQLGKLSAHKHILLVVTESQETNSIVTHALRAEGLYLLHTDDIATAFEMLAIHKVGVVLCEHGMQSMKGSEFLRRVKELHPDVVRMMLSDAGEISAMIDAANRGVVYKFLTRPWNESQLQLSVQDAFHQYAISRDNYELSRQLQALRVQGS